MIFLKIEEFVRIALEQKVMSIKKSGKKKTGKNI